MAHYGKFRGTVVDNVDPEQRGRVQVRLHDVFGAATASSWAEPCLPPGYWSMPPVDAEVWIEFERGDPAFPIWVGVRAAPSEGPGWPVAVELRTQSSPVFTAGPSRVAVMNGLGAQIELEGPTVRTNGGALEVT
jgi:hypothetical protein